MHTVSFPTFPHLHVTMRLAHTVRVQSFRVVWTGTGEVAHFLADEALGIGILPLRYFGLALLGCVTGRTTLEADASS